jgi:hypothetical protein
VVAEEVGVRQDGERFQQAVVIVGTQEHGDLLAVAGDLESLVGGGRLLHQSRQLSAGLCHRQGLSLRGFQPARAALRFTSLTSRNG